MQVFCGVFFSERRPLRPQIFCSAYQGLIIFHLKLYSLKVLLAIHGLIFLCSLKSAASRYLNDSYVINQQYIYLGEPRRLWVVHGGNVSHIMMSSFWLSSDVFMTLLRSLAWNQAQSQDVMKAAASFHCIKTAFYLLVPPILLHPNQQSLAFHANTAFCAFVFSPLAKFSLGFN